MLVCIIIQWELVWALFSSCRLDIKLSIDDIMVCNTRKSVCSIDLGWMVGENQIKNVVVSGRYFHNLCEALVVGDVIKFTV